MESTEKRKVYIYILEGPAGAGKTTVTRALEARGVKVIRSSLTKRSLESTEAALLSAENDYSKAIQAVHRSLGLNEVVCIERFVWSQMVYGRLRNPEHCPPLYYLDRMTKTVLENAREDLMWRLGDLHRGGPHIHPVIITLLPSAEDLNSRRATGGKEYPWMAEEEIAEYDKLIQYTELDKVVIKHGGISQVAEIVNNIIEVHQNVLFQLNRGFYLPESENLPRPV